MNSSSANILYADACFIDKHKLSIDLDDKDVYFAGDCIKGGIRIPYHSDLHRNSRLDIHLSCTFKPSDGSGANTKLFKALLTPCLVVTPNIDYVPFSIPIPNDIPSTLKGKTLPGTMTYKLKVIHELIDLPVSLYPKASIEICILALIAANDPAYQSPISNEKELKAIPSNNTDATGKNKATAKLGNKTDSASHVNCRLSIPTSCYLEGQNIPILIHVQHVAPVKQMQGIQLQLERITNMTTAETGERSVETSVVSEVILPLICDVDDHSSTVNSHLTVPASTPPTLQTNISPLHICYRIKAIINVDINNLLDDTAAPSRKRDIAKGMVNSWGKRIGWTVDGTATGILPGSIVELELPITIGTTQSMTTKDTSSSSSSSLSIHSLSNDSQSSLSIISTPSCPPKLPVRPASISNQSASSPNIQSSTTHQQLTSSPIGDNLSNSNKYNWAKPTIHKTIRSITDPFSLANHQAGHLTYGTAEQQPSAPELGEIEQLDIKNRNWGTTSLPSHQYHHGRSKSTPPQDMEKHTLYMANS